MAGANYKQKLNDINNTGFGPNSSVEGGRLINPDGSTNLRKRGIPIWERTSIYHTLLKMDRKTFLLSIFVFYTSINILFAIIYYVIGAHHLLGLESMHTSFERFTGAFFFSSQTLTTVGYGHVAPDGLLTNAIASIESLIGILSFAVVTGLIYGRFSRPRAYLAFSDNLLIAPYKDGRGLMLRLVTYKNNHLTDVDANLTLALHVREGEKMLTKFYPLPLELPRINSMALSWTLVHNLNEDSPLYNFTEKDIADSKMEVIVNIKGFDDHFSNVVQQRTSYTHDQVIFGARFLPMFERSENRQYTLLELDKINYHERVQLPDYLRLENVS